MISHVHGLIFVHVPKCAGMAVEVALGGLPPAQHAEQHFTSAQLRAYHPDAWEAYHRFAVVRHPVARSWSFVRFIRRYDPVWRRHLGHVDDATLLWDLLMSTNLLTTHTCARMVDDDVEVLQQEQLATAWPAFADRHRLPDALPRRNAGPDAPRPDDPALALAIAALFEEDFTRFGYALPDVDPRDLDLPDQGRVAWARLRARAQRTRLAEPDALPALRAWLEAWAEALPVAPWRDRWAAATAAHPLDASDPRALVVWTETVHDHVRAALGAPLWHPWSP